MTVERVEDGGVVSTRNGAFGYAEVHIEDNESALFVGKELTLSGDHSDESDHITFTRIDRSDMKILQGLEQADYVDVDEVPFDVGAIVASSINHRNEEVVQAIRRDEPEVHLVYR